MKLLIFLSFLLFGFQSQAEPYTKGSTEVISGHAVKAPSYLVSLVEEGDEDGSFVTFCGGTLFFSHNIVVTAAHCVDSETKDLKVIIGLEDKSAIKNEEILKVLAVSIHSNWTGNVHDNYDIAVLLIENPSQFGDPISLTTENPLKASNVDVFGHGLISNVGYLLDNSAHTATLPIVDLLTCQLLDKNLKPEDQNIFCAGDMQKGNGFCRGDSGGPAVVYKNGEPQLAGVVSNVETCGSTPSVFTNIFSFRSWITDEANSLLNPPSNPTLKELARSFEAYCYKNNRIESLREVIVSNGEIEFSFLEEFTFRNLELKEVSSKPPATTAEIYSECAFQIGESSFKREIWRTTDGLNRHFPIYKYESVSSSDQKRFFVPVDFHTKRFNISCSPTDEESEQYIDAWFLKGEPHLFERDSEGRDFEYTMNLVTMIDEKASVLEACSDGIAGFELLSHQGIYYLRFNGTGHTGEIPQEYEMIRIEKESSNPGDVLATLHIDSRNTELIQGRFVIKNDLSFDVHTWQLTCEEGFTLNPYPDGTPTNLQNSSQIFFSGLDPLGRIGVGEEITLNFKSSPEFLENPECFLNNEIEVEIEP